MLVVCFKQGHLQLNTRKLPFLARLSWPWMPGNWDFCYLEGGEGEGQGGRHKCHSCSPLLSQDP